MHQSPCLYSFCSIVEEHFGFERMHFSSIHSLRITVDPQTNLGTLDIQGVNSTGMGHHRPIELHTRLHEFHEEFQKHSPEYNSQRYTDQP